jgi:hypothetical protein
MLLKRNRSSGETFWSCPGFEIRPPTCKGTASYRPPSARRTPIPPAVGKTAAPPPPKVHACSKCGRDAAPGADWCPACEVEAAQPCRECQVRPGIVAGVCTTCALRAVTR